MFDNQELNNVLNGIGAMAEMTALFYAGLLKNGVDAPSASRIAGDFIKAILNNGKDEK